MIIDVLQILLAVYVFGGVAFAIYDAKKNEGTKPSRYLAWPKTIYSDLKAKKGE